MNYPFNTIDGFDYLFPPIESQFISQVFIECLSSFSFLSLLTSASDLPLEFTTNQHRPMLL